MRSQGIGAALLLGVVLTLAGCTGTVDDPPAATATAGVSTPTPEATQEAESEVKAKLAFDGDCTAALNDETLTSVLGEGHLLVPDVSVDIADQLTDSAAAAAGITSCTWSDAADTTRISAVMAPLSIVDPAIVENPAPFTCAEDVDGSGTCVTDVVVGDAWLWVAGEQSHELDKSVIPALGGAMVDQHPRAATLPEDTWAPQLCEALPAVIATAIPGGNPVAEPVAPAGPSASAAEEVERLLAGYGTRHECTISGVSAQNLTINITTIAGMKTFATVLPEITIPGADLAFGADTGPQLAFGGSNLLSVSDTNTAAPSAAVAREVAAALLPAQGPRPSPTPTEDAP